MSEKAHDYTSTPMICKSAIDACLKKVVWSIGRISHNIEELAYKDKSTDRQSKYNASGMIHKISVVVLLLIIDQIRTLVFSLAALFVTTTLLLLLVLRRPPWFT